MIKKDKADFQIKRFFCRAFLGKNKIKRDLAVFATVSFILAFFIVAIQFKENQALKREALQSQALIQTIPAEEEIYHQVKTIQEAVDASSWKKYQSNWYGFKISYPAGWAFPQNQNGSRASRWEYRYQFRKSDLSGNNPFSGFDLAVYNLSKIGELSNTEEFPLWKSREALSRRECAVSRNRIFETGDYPAEEIYTAPGDECYKPVLFFSFTKGDYIYNLVPATKEGVNLAGDPKKEIADSFPEFFSIASTLNPTEIIRPKPKPQVQIDAPLPVSFKVVNGRRVCAKKNDKPSKSKKDKGKHLDMECCLDPDEYPNPHCYYSPEKYGEYL